MSGTESGTRARRPPGAALAVLLGLVVACADDVGTVGSPSRTTGASTSLRGGVPLAPVSASARLSTPKPVLGELDGTSPLRPKVTPSVQLGEREAVSLVTVQANVSWFGRTREQYLGVSDSGNYLVILVPEDPLLRPRTERVDRTGKVFFTQVPPGLYHLLYKVDYNTFASGQAHSLMISFPKLDVHDQAANVVAYWCRPNVLLDGGTPTYQETFDLFWNNGALPRNPGPGTAPASRDESEFRASVDSFVFSPFISGNRSFVYSVIVASVLEPMKSLWISPWKAAEAGKVEIPWNGYVLDPAKASGVIRRLVDPKEAGAERLAAGEYLYAIQFREIVGKASSSGIGAPEMLGLFALPVGEIPQDEGMRQGRLSFQTFEFGQTLFSQFTLIPAPIATDSASPVASPTVTP
jgi:hypothetical protein